MLDENHGPRLVLKAPAPVTDTGKTDQPSHQAPTAGTEIAHAFDNSFVDWVAAGNLPS